MKEIVYALALLLFSFLAICFYPYIEKNEVFPDEDEVLVTGKRNISPSRHPLPNCMRINNKRKRYRPFDLEFPLSAIFYINPEFFGFHNMLAPNPCFSDNLYFERLIYSLNNN
jgi:hypothetical protein